MTIYTYDKVALYPTKSGTCAHCGVRTKRTTEMFQTISPFNKLPDGTLKTREDILVELEARAEAWKAEPVLHKKCEGVR